MNAPTDNFRAVIIDDSREAREDIEAQLRDDPEVGIVAQCTDREKAAETLLQHRPDILFLEANMPGLTAADLLARLPAPRRPKVIFMAADARFALQAFEVHAVDYLLKPFNRARFAEAVGRAKAAVQHRAFQTISHRLDTIMGVLQAPRPPAPEVPAAKVREEKGRIFIRHDGEIHLVAPGDIRWIQTDGDYVRLHTLDKSHYVRMPLSRMLQKLDPAHFVRIHRSFAINLRHMSRATPTPNGEYMVNLVNGTRLKVSRTFVRSLKTHL